MDLKKELIVEEFKDLKQEHATYRKELETTERIVIAAVGLLVSWIEAKEMSNYIIKALPTVLILFGGLRSYTIGNQIKILKIYLIKIEDYAKLQSDDNLGWERFCELKTKKGMRTKVTTFFWVSFLIISIVWFIWPMF